MTVNNLPVGRSVDETLRLLQAFQFTSEHGEVCPANWTPGDKTMVPNPTDVGCVGNPRTRPGPGHSLTD